MKKALTTATFLTVIAMPAFAQSADADLGTGNIAPLAATNQGGASAYAQAPDTYETGYTRSSMNRSGHTRKHERKNMDATRKRGQYVGARRECRQGRYNPEVKIVEEIPRPPTRAASPIAAYCAVHFGVISILSLIFRERMRGEVRYR